MISVGTAYPGNVHCGDWPPQGSGLPLGGTWWGAQPTGPTVSPYVPSTTVPQRPYMPSPPEGGPSFFSAELGYLRDENERLRRRIEELESRMRSLEGLKQSYLAVDEVD